jgi:hypothetical protein
MRERRAEAFGSRSKMGVIGKSLFVLWCIIWIPSVVFMLSERLDAKPSALENAIRIVSAVNVLGFYVAGPLWLARRCAGRPAGRICLACAVLLYLNPLGPMALPVCRSVLGRERQVQQ